MPPPSDSADRSVERSPTLRHQCQWSIGQNESGPLGFTFYTKAKSTPFRSNGPEIRLFFANDLGAVSKYSKQGITGAGRSAFATPIFLYTAMAQQKEISI